MKGFFLLVSYEEHEIPIQHDDSVMSAPHYIFHNKNPFILFDDSLIHGFTYDVHLSHLKTHDFPCSLLSSIDVGGTSSNTWVKRYMIGENYYR